MASRGAGRGRGEEGDASWPAGMREGYSPHLGYTRSLADVFVPQLLSEKATRPFT